MSNFYNSMTNLPPNVLAAFLKDPRISNSQKMIDEGTDSSPVQHPLQGVSRMLKAGLGSYQMGKAQDEYVAKGDAYNKALANMLKSGNLDGMISAAAENPMLSEIGTDLALKKATSDYEVQKLMAIEGMKQRMDPKNQIIFGGAPQIGQQATGEPSLPPQVGGQMVPMPPMPAELLQPDAKKYNPNAALGSYIQSDGQPAAAFDAGTQPQIDGLYNAAVSEKFSKPREGYVWVRGEDGMPKEIKDTSNPRKLSPTEQKELFEKMDLVNAGTGAMSALDYAQKVLDEGNSFAGFGAETLAAANRVPVIGGLIDDKGATDTTLIKNAVTEQALNQLKAIFGGMPTEGERQILLQLQALPSYNRDEQKRILARAREAANNRLQYNQSLVSGIQTGDYKNAGFGNNLTQQQPVKRGRIKVASPDGKMGTIDATEVNDAIQNGWRVVE